MNRNIKIIIGVVVLGVLWGGYVLLQPSSKPSNIKIGLITGLTGEYSFVGENYKKGVVLAYENYKKENPESNVEIIIENDGFDPKKGLSAYKKLTEINKIDALINLTSPTIGAIYSSVTKTDLPVIQGGEQEREPTNDNVFQITPGNIVAEEKLGEYTKNLNLENVAIIYGNNTTFIRFFEAFKRGYGGNLVEYKLDLATKEHRTVTTKILAKNPSAIVFLATPDQGALLIKEILKQTKDIPKFIFDANIQTGINDYKRILGDSLIVLNGSIAMNIETSMNEDFVRLYKERYDEEPGIATDWAYDSFNLLMKTYDKDGKKWTSNIKGANFEGAGGAVIFDKVGVRIPQFKIKTMENGKFVDKT